MFVQPENSIEVDIFSLLSGGSTASKASERSDEYSASSSLDAVSYDSSMHRIRKEVWDKVREAKRKVGKKGLTDSLFGKQLDWHLFFIRTQRQKAKNAMKERLRSEIEISSSSLSQEKGTAYTQAQRKAGFVLVNGPDDEGPLEGDHLSAEQIAWSHSRNVPRSILDSFETQPLLDTDDVSAGKATWEEHVDLSIQDHIPGYDGNSEPSTGQVVREKASMRRPLSIASLTVLLTLPFHSPTPSIIQGIAEITKIIEHFQDEEIDSIFGSILAIQLDETNYVSTDQVHATTRNVQMYSVLDSTLASNES
jgi:hypothetical protein